MNLGILITGDTCGTLKQQYGSFAQMFVDLFAKAGYSFEYQYFDIRAGEFPAHIQQCDAWLITGSVNGVYENLPWMMELQTFIQQLAADKIPLLGICFGHQIIASALGGEVQQSSKGWGLGQHSYELLINPISQVSIQPPTKLVINAMHQDQVVCKPPSAVVFAQSEFCPYAGLIYADHIFSIQAHPEFNDAYTLAQLADCRGTEFPESLVDQVSADAERSLEPLDSLLVAKWMAELVLKASE